MDQGRRETGRPSLRAMGPTAAGFGALAVLLWTIQAYNFLLFHSLAELFSVVVGFAAFIVTWYSRDWIGRNYLLLIGFSHLFVGGLDTLHTLAYKGIAVFQGYDASLSSQLWMAARALEAVCLLIAVWSPQRRYRADLVLGVLTLATAVLLASVFGGLWPRTFVEGGGVTPFKSLSEIGLAGLFLAALLRLRRQAANFDRQIYDLLAFCILAKVATELTVVWYVDLFGLANVVGHVLKVVGAWLFLKAVVDSGLRRPQSLIFGALERERVLSDEVSRHGQTLDAVLDATLDPVIMFGASGQVRFFSRAAERFFGRSAREVVGRTWREAGLADAVMAPLEQVSTVVMDHGAARTEEIAVPLRGMRTCLELQACPLTEAGELSAVVAVIRDVTARKAMEDELKASLDDNRVLMMEVHHRVNNNLQIVSSILQMQGWRMTDPALRGKFEEACGRILALAKVHELLYAQESVASLDFAVYIRALCADLFRRHEGHERVVLTAECAPLPLPIDKAEPLALIVHELVSNALKHAFRDRSGELRIRLASVGDGEAALVVDDDGVTAARTLDFAGDSASLGLRMVGVLVKQIHGTVAVAQEGGTRIEVRFPLDENRVEELVAV